MTAFTLIDGLLLSLLSIVFVIIIIIIIIIFISPLKKFSQQKPKQQSKDKIKDYDMLLAALIASIEFKTTTNKEPYLKSIKEITNEDL